MLAIKNVELSVQEQEEFIGFSIDLPRVGQSSEGYSFTIAGWILGKNSRADVVEVVHRDLVIQKFRVNGTRQDVNEKFRGIPYSSSAGFWGEIGVVGLPSTAELHLSVILDNGNRLPLATIEVEYSLGGITYAPVLNPILLVTTGRTGSSMLMQILSYHPEIVVFRDHPTFECYAGQYWLHMAKVLSQPANHDYSTPPYGFDQNQFLIGANPFYQGFIRPFLNTISPTLKHWFDKEYVNRLITTSQSYVDEFYIKVYQSQISDNILANQSRFFLEKHMLAHRSQELMLQIYAHCKELFLVRDFRDIYCSINSYNARMSKPAFDRDRVDTDEEFIQEVLKKTACEFLRRWNERKGHAYLVHYEDLILDPEESLRKMLGYLTIDYSPAVIKEMLFNSKTQNRIPHGHKTTQNPASSIGRWKSEMKPALQELFLEELGTPLKELGYL